MKNWKDTLIGQKATLKEAMLAIDLGGLRIALVVDEVGRLLGTITDGDLRRALLAGRSHNSPAIGIMCHAPRTAPQSMTTAQKLAIMKAERIHHLPLITEDGRVVDLATLDTLIDGERRDNPVLIMAGGFGKRLGPLTENCPKPLLPIGGKPIIELILESFIGQGFHKFYVSTHYLAGMIIETLGNGSNWGVEIEYLKEAKPLGTGGAVGLLPKHKIEKPLIVANGDLLTNIDFRNLIEFHEKCGGTATMCMQEFSYQIPFGVIKNKDHWLVDFEEKPSHTVFTNAGIYVLAPELVKTIEPNKHIDLPAIIQSQKPVNEKVALFLIREYWADIGRLEDLQKAQATYREP